MYIVNWITTYIFSNQINQEKRQAYACLFSFISYNILLLKGDDFLNNFFTMKETVITYIDTCHSKLNSPLGKLIGKAILAGMMISMGAACSSVAAHNITNVGLARLTAGVVFPVGLMMVILFGANLFTGDCLVSMSVFDKKEKVSKCAKLLVLVYIGNFIGAFLTAFMIVESGQLDYSSGLLGAYTIKVALGKVNLPFAQAVVSGILCNILVCAAVLMAICAKDISGKILVSFFVIMLFVTGGFEHCVANMYYITSGLMAANNPEYVEMAMSTYGYTQETLAALNIVNFFKVNLLPVTIGNIIGGSFVIGGSAYYLNK